MRWLFSGASTRERLGICRRPQEFMDGDTFTIIERESELRRKLPPTPPEHPSIAAVNAERSGQVDGSIDPVFTQERLQSHTS